jgi:hypothetical protein
VTEQYAIRAYLNSDLHRELPQPVSVVVVRVPKSIIIRDFGEIVVARIGVTALTMRKSVADRVVVISLNNWNCCVTHNLTNPIGKWTECAKISKAEKSPDPACSRVLEESFESEIVAVDTPEEPNALRGVLRLEIQAL